MSKTVFVTQEPWPDRETGEPVRDFTPAEKWGRLKILLPHDHNPDGLLYDDIMTAGFDAYVPGDYIVCSGHPVVIGAVCAIAAQRGPLNLLVWSGRLRNYDNVVFNLPEKQDA